MSGDFEDEFEEEEEEDDKQLIGSDTTGDDDIDRAVQVHAIMSGALDADDQRRVLIRKQHHRQMCTWLGIAGVVVVASLIIAYAYVQSADRPDPPMLVTVGSR